MQTQAVCQLSNFMVFCKTWTVQNWTRSPARNALENVTRQYISREAKRFGRISPPTQDDLTLIACCSPEKHFVPTAVPSNRNHTSKLSYNPIMGRRPASSTPSSSFSDESSSSYDSDASTTIEELETQLGDLRKRRYFQSVFEDLAWEAREWDSEGTAVSVDDGLYAFSPPYAYSISPASSSSYSTHQPSFIQPIRRRSNGRGCSLKSPSLCRQSRRLLTAHVNQR
ncbi:hypothetical protein BT69DRAFT_1352188, partial [Atractiella rhizophila]